MIADEITGLDLDGSARPPTASQLRIDMPFAFRQIALKHVGGLQETNPALPPWRWKSETHSH